MRGAKAIKNKHSRAILKEALENPEFAKELLKLDATQEGKTIIKSIFAPVATSVITKEGE